MIIFMYKIPVEIEKWLRIRPQSVGKISVCFSKKSFVYYMQLKNELYEDKLILGFFKIFFANFNVTTMYSPCTSSRPTNLIFLLPP